ncbi:MAG: hypothetical protein EP343_24125 [Deltaproteobacteria bacterium]|nr:MAG: hypothetical protein EP343_24125 [Deltaproteobacteria bacterium]
MPPPPYEDNLSKYVMRAVLQSVGEVEVGSELLPDSFRADVLFIPSQPLPPLPGAGRLTDWIGERRCVLEAFSRKVTSSDLRSAQAKLSLAMWRSYKDHLGSGLRQGCLIILSTYWPRMALAEIFGDEYDMVEEGVRRWKLGRDHVYVVNTQKIVADPDTLLFRILGNRRLRHEAYRTILERRIEPYVTALNEFDLEYNNMSTSEQLQNMNPQLLQELQDYRYIRSEVLKEMGREEGRLEEAKHMLLRLLNKRYPSEQEWETEIAPLRSREAVEVLLDQILDGEERTPEEIRCLFEQA